MTNRAFAQAPWGVCLAAVALSTWPAMAAADGLLDPLRRDDGLDPRTPPGTIRNLGGPGTRRCAVAKEGCRRG